MELGADRDPHGAWGDPPAGTFIIPCGLPPPGALPVSQQPLWILQQLPGAVPTLPTPTRPPHVQADFWDLMELMMLQNSQMHQVVMNSLAVTALMAWGSGTAPASAQVMASALQTPEGEEPLVFHHHYIPSPGPAPLLAWPVPGDTAGMEPGMSPRAEDGPSVPPPPPPSATGTVGASVPPAAEYYDLLEERGG
ncbi:proline-rich protein 29 [Phaethornis superciliosus]